MANATSATMELNARIQLAYCLFPRVTMKAGIISPGMIRMILAIWVMALVLTGRPFVNIYVLDAAVAAKPNKERIMAPMKNA